MENELDIQYDVTPTILLIEDNPDILENLSEFLELEGYKILAANNGKKGLELAAAFKPDLIICDVLMREMDGYEVLRLLLNSPKTQEIPFIFSTSMSEKVDRAEAMKLGAADYIVKPFELKTLFEMVKVHLQCGMKSIDERKQTTPVIPHFKTEQSN